MKYSSYSICNTSIPQHLSLGNLTYPAEGGWEPVKALRKRGAELAQFHLGMPFLSPTSQVRSTFHIQLTGEMERLELILIAFTSLGRNIRTGKVYFLSACSFHVCVSVGFLLSSQDLLSKHRCSW